MAEHWKFNVWGLGGMSAQARGSATHGTTIVCACLHWLASRVLVACSMWRTPLMRTTTTHVSHVPSITGMCLSHLMPFCPLRTGRLVGAYWCLWICVALHNLLYRRYVLFDLPQSWGTCMSISPTSTNRWGSSMQWLGLHWPSPQAVYCLSFFSLYPLWPQATTNFLVLDVSSKGLIWGLNNMHCNFFFFFF